MKELLITLVLLLSFTHICKAQMPVIPQKLNKYIVIDTLKYVITYELNIINDIQNPKKTVNDIVVLEIGNTKSKSYSNLLYQADSTAFALSKKGVRNLPLFQEVVPPVIVYKNYPHSENTVIYRTPLNGPIFKYKEAIPKINWKLLTEKKIIMGYSCQKAETTFRGRTYEAWFTSQIPLKEGPYKFHGLPGLILEISDSQKHYIFNCIGIQLANKEEPILYWDWEIQETSREKLNNLIKRFHEQPANVAQTLGIRVSFMDSNNNTKDSKTISYPYNPIELE